MAQVGDASDLGTRIHDALEKASMGDMDIDPSLLVYVTPVLEWMDKAKIGCRG
jgi:hypothetical protein